MKTIQKRSLRAVATKSSSFLVYPKLVVLFAILTFVLLLSRIYFSNQLAVSGARISYAENKASQLVKENYELENQIGTKSSLSYIEAKAKETGMVKIDKVEVLRQTQPVALKE